MSSAVETLALWRRTSLIWGTTDCIMATCDHVQRVTGVDPAKPWRGTYDDEQGAKAIYEAHGGVLNLFDYGMELAGFERGDRAVGRPVVARFGETQITGIDMGRRCAFLLERGVIEMPANVLAAWVI